MSKHYPVLTQETVETVTAVINDLFREFDMTVIGGDSKQCLSLRSIEGVGNESTSCLTL